MITEIEREGKTAKELAEAYEKDVEAYKEELAKISDQKKLEEAEAEALEGLAKVDEYIKGVKYELPEDVTFENTHYSKNDVAKLIIYFVNKNEVTWQYTLGLYELVKLWKQNDTKIVTYGEFDSTLRLLDQCKFKGYSEWKDILVINEYFKPLHEAYSKDIAQQIWLSHRHNAILDRMELIAPVKTKKEEKES